MPDDSERRTAADGGRDAPGAELERLRALVEYFGEANEQLETVNRIVAAVNTGRSIEEVFELASEQVRALVPFDRASLALCEEDGETLRVYALTGERAGSLSVGARGPLKGSVTELALTERRTVVIPELSEERRFNVYADLRREGFRSAVCVPLFSMRRAVGSLNLTNSAPDAYRRAHLLALERLAPPARHRHREDATARRELGAQRGAAWTLRDHAHLLDALGHRRHLCAPRQRHLQARGRGDGSDRHL